MRLQELVQSCHVYKDGKDKAVQGKEGEHGKPERELDEEEHDYRDRHQNGKQCLHLWKDQDIKGQQALREFFEF